MEFSDMRILVVLVYVIQYATGVAGGLDHCGHEVCSYTQFCNLSLRKCSPCSPLMCRGHEEAMVPTSCEKLCREKLWNVVESLAVPPPQWQTRLVLAGLAFIVAFVFMLLLCFCIVPKLQDVYGVQVNSSDDTVIITESDVLHTPCTPLLPPAGSSLAEYIHEDVLLTVMEYPKLMLEKVDSLHGWTTACEYRVP